MNQAMHALLNGTAFTVYDADDRKKQPTPILVRNMTMDEVQNLVPNQWYEFVGGGFGRNAFDIRRVRMSSVKLRGRGVLRGVDSIKFKYGAIGPRK